VLPKTEKNDLRSRRTRKLLQHAMIKLLEERDFNDLSVHDIAELAEVNRATFYAHFYDKYDLFNQWVRETFQEWLERSLPPDAAPSKDSLRILIVIVCEFLDSFMGRCKSPHPGTDNSIMMRQVQTCVSDVVMQWLFEVSDESERYIDQIRARMVSWGIFGSAMEWASESRKRFTAEQVADEIMPLLTSACYPLMAQSVPQR
jgi:AcrR family transcriptional regulator